MEMHRSEDPTVDKSQQKLKVRAPLKQLSAKVFKEVNASLRLKANQPVQSANPTNCAIRPHQVRVIAVEHRLFRLRTQ